MEFRYGTMAIRVNVPDAAHLAAEVAACLSRRQGFALATINLDHLTKLARSQGFRHAYAAQDMVVADGNPVVWLSRLAGRPVTLLPGSDLVVPLARIAQANGVAIALLGSAPDALDAAAVALQAAVPGLRIACRLSPPMGFDPQSAEAATMLAEVADSGARLCFVALGAPRQEMLAARGRRIAPQVGFVSVGAGLDFLAGTQTRAPGWVRAIAMEWLWRMVSDPKRLAGRYAACAAILPGEVMRALALRRETPAD